jgi:transcriptional regulator with XRE-family HTH domain
VVTLPQPPRAGELLRAWRQRRRLSQLELSLDSAVSTRHLSFIETGRARPSREMVLHLAERLEIPLRERNGLLLAAGYAPAYSGRSLDDPEMAVASDALERLLGAHQPYPAVVLDRAWNIVGANDSVRLLLEDVAPRLLEPPANALQITLQPDGMAPRIANLAEWSGHLLQRVRRRAAITGDRELARLHAELAALPGVCTEPPGGGIAAEIALPLRLRRGRTELAFISTQTTFGTAIDVTLAELSLEAFYPADAVTANALHDAGAQPPAVTPALP